MTDATVTPRTSPVFLAAKRFLDIAVSLAVLLALSPALLLIAIAIKLTSPGPVFFRGTVHGKDGVPFTYYKFRSMVAGGDTSQHKEFIKKYVAEGKGHVDDSGKEVFKLTGDKRITTIGKIIRRISIDEVPQMINVLRGEMSLVGPRPPVPYEFELYDDAKKLRLLVKPGITGLNQIRRRSQSTFEQMYADDLEYIRNQSIPLDLAIMIKTPWVMLFGSGPT
ncbi:MAG TPA: sugar transferase [Candidatus Hydrogenedentes bacterium]|nr:sugar transferase [Candidatus Hydrogenedentota bacterium]